MPFFFLPPEEVKFPPAHFAGIDGQLAQGGELTAEWIVEGFKSGVYLWASPMEPLKWWSPDPRLVIFPDQIDLKDEYQTLLKDKTLKTVINGDINRCLDFCEKIENSKEINPRWVTGQFRNVYAELHSQGMVHNIQLWKNDHLTACAFGTLLGKVFFCEYVSATEYGLAEVALIKLSDYLEQKGIKMMDIHKDTNATDDIGIREMSRNEYIDLIKRWVFVSE